MSLEQELNQAHRERMDRLHPGAPPPVIVRPKKDDQEKSLEEVITELREQNAKLIEALERLCPTEEPIHRRPTIQEIKRIVARYYGVTVNDLESPCRAARCVRPRHVACYLIRERTIKSFPEIGRRLGGRDHTTAMSAVDRINDLLSWDTNLADDIQVLHQHIDFLVRQE